MNMKPRKNIYKVLSILLIAMLPSACGGGSDDSKQMEQTLACLIFPLYCFIPISKAEEPGSGLYLEQLLPSDDEIGMISNVTDFRGNVYSAGYTIGSFGAPGDTGGMDAIVLKHDPGGNLVWFKRFGSSDRESGVDVSVNTDGSVLVTIVKLRIVEGDASRAERELYRLQLSNNGEVLDAWQVMTPEG